VVRLHLIQDPRIACGVLYPDFPYIIHH